MTAKPTSKILTIGKRIAIVVVVLVALMIGVLQIAERSEDALRLGVQDFLTQMTGNPAEVTDLPKSELFPEIVFHAKGVVIRDRTDAEKVLVKAGDGYIAIDFWRSFLGFGTFNGLEIRNMETAAGFPFPARMNLTFTGISDPPPHEASPALLLEGIYNGQPLMVTLEMRRHGDKKLKYDFGRVIPMTFKLGAFEASGYMERNFNASRFEKITAVHGDHQAIFAIEDIKADPLNLKATGTIDDIPFKADLAKEEALKTLTITTAEPKVIGKVIEPVIRDLGLSNDSETFRIDIRAEDTNTKESDKK